MYWLIGGSWLLFWLLVKVFMVETLNAALATGIVFIVLGLLLEGAPNIVKKS